jgi:hypothetical protein
MHRRLELNFGHLRRRLPNLFPAALMAVVLSFSLVAARAATFTASLDRDSITLGETATLSLMFEGGSPGNAPSVPGVRGLEINYVGPSSQFSFINGQTTSTVTYRYVITPRQPGKFTVPALRVNVDGQWLNSPPLTLSVFQANAPSAAAVSSGSETAFMQLVVSRKKVYVGQMIQAELKIYLRDDVQNFANFHFTATPASGFSIGKMNQGQNERVQMGSRVYTVVPLSFTLTAVQRGALSVGPFTAGATLLLPSADGGGGDPFFRQFFNQGEQKPVSLATEKLDFQCLPLPAENVPANFNGAVGSYNLAITAGPTNVAVGDPITVRVQISGRGDLDAIALPDQPAWRNFKVFPPTSKVENTDQLGLAGRKTFEEIVSPQNTDVHELPPFAFSFFNPDDGKYHTLNWPAVPLAVHSGGTTVMPTIAAGQNSAPQNQTPQDILPIKENLGTLAKNSTPLVIRPAYLLIQSLPVLAFLAAFVWRKRTDSLANNPRLRRKITVEKLIQSGIADLRKFAAENSPEEFFALLFRLLQEQLGERLDCPATAITENVVEENSLLRGAADATRTDLRELFQLCNQARYAPVRGTSELNSVAAQFEKTIGELQEVKA